MDAVAALRSQLPPSSTLPVILLEAAGRVLAMVAQIKAKQWVRNGESVATEQYHYTTAPQCLLLRDLDLKTVQVGGRPMRQWGCCCGVGDGGGCGVCVLCACAGSVRVRGVGEVSVLGTA